MTSTSSFGSSIITLQFNLDLNIDIAEQEVQAAITALPIFFRKGSRIADLQQDQSRGRPDPNARALRPNLSRSPRSKTSRTPTLAQKISQLSGVGLVSISGGQRPAVRIQANPTALAS